MTATPPPYGQPWPAPRAGPDPPPRSRRKSVIWGLVATAVLIVLGLIGGAAFLLLNNSTPRETAEAFVNSYADGDCQAGWDLMATSARDKLGDPEADDAPTPFCDRWKPDPGERFTIVDLVTITETDNEATVKVTTLSDANGEETVTIHLVKDDDAWKIAG